MLVGEHRCAVEVHSVCALQHMDNAGASGLGVQLGLLKHDTQGQVGGPTAAMGCQLRGAVTEHILAISATVPGQCCGGHLPRTLREMAGSTKPCAAAQEDLKKKCQIVTNCKQKKTESAFLPQILLGNGTLSALASHSRPEHTNLLCVLQPEPKKFRRFFCKRFPALH